MDRVAESRDKKSRLVERDNWAKSNSYFLGTIPLNVASDWKRWTWGREVKRMTPDLLE